MSMNTGENKRNDPIIGTLAVTLHEFEGEREDMLPFKKGEVLTIIEMNANGWWKGTDVRGRVGIFPYSYVDVKITSQESFPYARAIYALPPNPNDPELLSFEQHEVITITKQVNQDWSFGRRANGDEGRFPLKYVELTGTFNEEMFKAEMEKWERLELNMKEEKEKILEEKALLERKFIEQERDEKEKQLQDELEKAKKEAEELKELQKKQADELREARLQLARMRDEIKAKEEKANAMMERAQAEAAALRKIRERKEARKSRVVKQRIGEDNVLIERAIREAGRNFEGLAPGPPPKVLTKVEMDIDEDPFSSSGIKSAKSKKLKPMMKPVYVNRPTTVVDVGTVEPKPKEEVDKKPPPMPVLPTKEVEVPKVEPKRKVLKKFAHLGKGQKCKRCGKSVGIANRVKACKGLYHTDCFRCSTCDKIIRNGEYVDRNDHPYCHKCHKRGFGPKGFGFGLSEGLVTDAEPGVGDRNKEKKAKAEVITQSYI